MWSAALNHGCRHHSPNSLALFMHNGRRRVFVCFSVDNSVSSPGARLWKLEKLLFTNRESIFLTLICLKTLFPGQGLALSHLPCLVHKPKKYLVWTFWAGVNTHQRTMVDLIREMALFRFLARFIWCVKAMALCFKPVLKSQTCLHLIGFHSDRHYGKYYFS